MEAPGSAPTPLPLLKRLVSSARGEARKGAKALEEKKPQEAIGHFSREIEISPKDPTGPYNLGTALSQAGNAAEALASLERARKEGRRDLAADAAYNAGETLYRAKDYEAAAAAFREALRRKPGDPEASWNYELCVRRAQEEKQKNQQRENDPRQEKQQRQDAKPSPTPGPSASQNDEQKRKQEEEKQFESKANMSRDKAEQLLSAIQQADLDEQKKKIAEQKHRRRVGRDW